MTLDQQKRRRAMQAKYAPHVCIIDSLVAQMRSKANLPNEYTPQEMEQLLQRMESAVADLRKVVREGA